MVKLYSRPSCSAGRGGRVVSASVNEDACTISGEMGGGMQEAGRG